MRFGFLSAVFVFMVLPTVAKADCSKRVQSQLSQWNSKELNAIEVQVSDSKTDALCVFNELEERVEISASACKLAEEQFTQCLGSALASALYEKVEDKWVSHLGEKQAWIARKGEFTKVNVPKQAAAKLQPSMAKQVWVSLATQELLTTTRAALAKADQVERSLASSDKAAEKTPDLINALLGLN